MAVLGKLTSGHRSQCTILIDALFKDVPELIDHRGGSACSEDHPNIGRGKHHRLAMQNSRDKSEGGAVCVLHLKELGQKWGSESGRESGREWGRESGREWGRLHLKELCQEWGSESGSESGRESGREWGREWG